MNDICLTEKVKAAGWAAKIDPDALDRIVKGLTIKGHPDLIVGLDNADDAGVFRINRETVPAGAYNNKKFCTPFLSIDEAVDKFTLDILFDPQTSGGLVFTLDESDAGQCIETLTAKGITSAIAGKVENDHSCGKITII